MFNSVLSEQVDIAVWMVDCVGCTLGFQRPVEIQAVRLVRFTEFVEERQEIVRHVPQSDDLPKKVVQISDLRDRWQQRVQTVKNILYLDGSLDCANRSGIKKRSKNPNSIASELQSRHKDRDGRPLDFSWVHPRHIEQAQYELRHESKPHSTVVHHRRHRQRYTHIG